MAYKATSYADLCQLYMQFMQNHFRNAVVVFDGYHSGPSTKDETHQRRNGTEIGVDVEFTPDMKKKPFLANPRNKQNIINMLGSKMEEDDIQVQHSPGDPITLTDISFLVEKHRLFRLQTKL